ncbi:response regulator [Dyadobacter psychrotolerans]|uniref:Response regulator transcription factor n=1 Tax=Dyadobacter psychrotolerans TaxID=2541721 RepID=A0A4R5DQH5_9BACT|nr:response regulator transcription factor [Dyadobacter psychrotolerans]TDE14430.1 response regulator transcription factor [Dyadobacter psychrotolerans]
MTQHGHILMIEDHEIVVSAVKTILKTYYPKTILHAAGNFQKGLRLLETGPAVDAVILDLDIPGGDSTKMIGALRQMQQDVPILIFTGQDEERYALRFLSAGANGFLSKNAPLEECVTALQAVVNHGKYVSKSVQQIITNNFFDRRISPKETKDHTELSHRENEILALLLEGKWTKEIATELKLKLTTVSTHKARIFKKMDVSNVIELFKKSKKEE